MTFFFLRRRSTACHNKGNPRYNALAIHQKTWQSWIFATSRRIYGCFIAAHAPSYIEFIKLDLTQLRYLGLSGCTAITDAGIAHLTGLTQLKSLNLGLCSAITDAGIAHLKGLTELHHLVR